MICVILLPPLPMALFWFLTAAMAALAVLFVIVPLLRTRASAGPSEVEANLEVLQGQRREIEADIAAGNLPADSRDEALSELVGRAATDLAPAPAPAATAGKPWPAALAAGLAVPALAFGLYLVLGTPSAMDPLVRAASAGKLEDHQIVAMVDSLATKMKDRPDDATGWSLLARSLSSLGRYKESAEAYERLAKLVPGDPQVLADYADILAMAQGKRLAGKPETLIRQALEIDPKHPKALALAASAAADAGDLPASLQYWQRLADSVPPDSEDAREVGLIITQLRQQAQATGVKLPPPREAPAATAAATPPKAEAKPAPARTASTTPGQSVSGSVAIAPEIAAKVSGSETVFIVARAEGGPRTPLAVIKANVRELPMKFALDDSQAMAPGVNISSASAVRIEARVSRTGNVIPQSGDLVGTSAPVKPGSRDVKIVVDKVVP
jgi:cytochrome c-type biogenesis protein CcmH